MAEKKERSLALRSEKARSLIGEIPSRLTRYGIVVMAIVLVISLLMAAFFPYRVVYMGELVYKQQVGDSCLVKMHFQGKRPEGVALGGQRLEIFSPSGVAAAALSSLSERRDSLGYSEATLRLGQEGSYSEGEMVDFKLVVERGTILSQLFRW